MLSTKQSFRRKTRSERGFPTHEGLGLLGGVEHVLLLCCFFG